MLLILPEFFFKYLYFYLNTECEYFWHLWESQRGQYRTGQCALLHLSHLQLSDGHVLIQQPFGLPIGQRRCGHGKLRRQGGKHSQGDYPSHGLEAQQCQVALPRCQEWTYCLERRMSEKRYCQSNWMVSHLSRGLDWSMDLIIGLRLLCMAAPLDWDQQVRLINLLAKRRSREVLQGGDNFLQLFSPDTRTGHGCRMQLACMYILFSPLAVSTGSLGPTRRLKNGKVAYFLISRPRVELKSVRFCVTGQPPSLGGEQEKDSRWLNVQERKRRFAQQKSDSILV